MEGSRVDEERERLEIAAMTPAQREAGFQRELEQLRRKWMQAPWRKVFLVERFDRVDQVEVSMVEGVFSTEAGANAFAEKMKARDWGSKKPSWQVDDIDVDDQAPR